MEKNREILYYPLARRLGGPQSWGGGSGEEENLLNRLEI
jgi:hypothetical protein